MKKVVSIRLDEQMIAKARDGLLSNGLKEEQCNSITQIVRLTFLYGLTTICTNPTSLPTTKSLNHIKNLTKSIKEPTLDTLTTLK